METSHPEHIVFNLGIPIVIVHFITYLFFRT